ncbi:MAG TPA: hypothetical protein VI229_00140 [Burkholderiales bacterium]
MSRADELKAEIQSLSEGIGAHKLALADLENKRRALRQEQVDLLSPFKVGDRVRVVNAGNGTIFDGRRDIVYEITRIHPDGDSGCLYDGAKVLKSGARGQRSARIWVWHGLRLEKVEPQPDIGTPGGDPVTGALPSAHTPRPR